MTQVEKFGDFINSLPTASSIGRSDQLYVRRGATSQQVLESTLLPQYNLKGYGAVGDGTTDDTAAIVAWLTAIQGATSLTVGYAPAGNYIFKSALSVGAGGKHGVTIYGDGPYQTILTYAGSSTTIDLLTIGDGISQCVNWNIHDFRIASNTVMSAGTALRMKQLCRSFLHNVVMDGQDGNGKLWNGFWFDSIDFVSMDGFEARGQNDAIRVCGTPGGGQADLFLRGGKVSSSTIGVHIGGGFGGFQIDDTDVIANNFNVIIDKSMTGTPNAQLFFGKGFAADSCTVGPNFQILDTGQSISVCVFTGAWIATGPGIGLYIGVGCTYRVMYTGGCILNNQHDGVYDASGGTASLTFTGVLVSDNGGSGFGWAFNASGSVNIQINDCRMANNHDGNISTVVNGNTSGGNTGDYFYPFGNGISMTFGDGPPTLPASRSSLYLRTDGSSTTTRLYINTNGSTGWTNVVTST